MLKRLAKSILLSSFGRHVFYPLIKKTNIGERYQPYLRHYGVAYFHVDREGEITVAAKGDYTETMLYWKGYEGLGEKTTLKIWRRLAKDSRIMFDVGAYHGIFSLIAARVNCEATIHVFEPMPPSFDLIRRNVELNVQWLNPERLRVNDCAVGEEAGEATIYYNNYHMTSSSLAGGPRAGNNRVVAVTTIDDYCERQGIRHPDSFKIDVEKYEPCVIAGMKTTLVSLPSIIMEILSDDVGESVERQLPSEYRKYFIDEERGLLPAAALTRREKHSRNYLLIAPSKLAVVEDLIVNR